MFDESILKSEELYIFRLRSLFAGYGYSKFKMSKFEEYDLYARNKSFLVSDNVITFTDTNGKLMALKPDVTLSIVRNCPTQIKGVERTYYDEKVYRVSRSSGSYKEITQIGIECMGKMDGYCICEVLMLAAESLRLISENSILAVSNLELVSDAIKEANVSQEAGERILTCIKEKNIHELTRVCAGEMMEPAVMDKLKALITIHGSAADVFEKLSEAGFAGKQVQRLKDAVDFLVAAGYGKLVRIDFSMISDINYYNGIVFNGFVSGVPSVVLSGGCYDRLMRKMGKRSGAIGFAVYLDELEKLTANTTEYDVDTILIYKEDDDPQLVKHMADAIKVRGESVYVSPEIPDKKRYRKIVYVNGNGGQQ